MTDTTEKVEALLSMVTEVLASAPTKSNLLDELQWGKDVETRFFAAKASKLPEVDYAVDRAALDSDIEHLSSAQKSLAGDEPVRTWLRAILSSAIDKNRLLLAMGTPSFGAISKEIYGGASSSFFGLPIRNIDLATHVLGRLELHGWDEAQDRDSVPIDAQSFASELTRRIEKHRPRIEIDVIVDDGCTSKAVAGMSRVRIRADATFSAWEADGLFCHEVETHAYSAQNGALQPYVPFLSKGGPRTTPTQEGLAVFGELYHRALAIPRLQRLAFRVKLVAMAEEGASFLDLFRFLVGEGYEEHDAFLDAARICRGGLVEGGAPFTKDACYLAGLFHVHAFLSAFVRGGFRDEVEILMSGRIALDDVLALAHLRTMGLLERPRHRPRWLQRWGTLLPYFAFSSFTSGVELRAVETHYEEVISHAMQAMPPAAD